MDASRRFSRLLDAAWAQAGNPSADKIALRVQEKLDVDISPSTIRGWLRDGRLPRSDDTFLAVLRLLPVAQPEELLALLRAARQAKADHRNSGTEPPGQGPVLLARPVARQLPAVLSDFIGRAGAVTALNGALTGTGAGRSRCMAVLSIIGAAGIGKTSLALWWAHGNLHEFPDGQLYVDLRGFGPTDKPVSPSVAICGFLTALGVPVADIPAEVDDQAALYRSLLAGRRTLVLLDNARDIDQVLPLLPGSPTCTVLITSRTRLTGLHVRGARLIELDTLPDEEAQALLIARIGAVAATQAESVTGLVRFCGGLPLALAIVAARASAQQGLPLACLVEELAEAGHRLDALDTGDAESSARAVFSSSYRALPAAAARAFRLLSLVTGPDVGLAACAALLDLQRVETRSLLKILAAAHLIQEHQPHRYRMHDLLRIFSIECLHNDESPVARQAAAERLVTWFCHTADAACHMIAPHRRRVLSSAAVIEPEFQTYDAALEWFTTEHRNMAAAVELAAERHLYELGWKLPVIMSGYYNLNKGWREYLSSLHIALTAARSAGSDFGRAWVLNALGATYANLARYEEATSCLEQSLALRRAIGDQRGASITINNLGETYRRAGRHEEAIEYFELDRRFCRDNGDEDGESICLNNLGKAWSAAGNLAEALRCLHLALAIRRRVMDLHEEAAVLNDLGEVYRKCRRYSNATRSYLQALDAYQRAGDALGTAQVTVSLAELAHEQGEFSEAQQRAKDALSISATVNEDEAPSLRNQIEGLQRRLRHDSVRRSAARRPTR